MALAFYHSHQSAVRDIGKYERYEEWPMEDGVIMEVDDLLEKMKRNVTKQVSACGRFSPFLHSSQNGCIVAKWPNRKLSLES